MDLVRDCLDEYLVDRNNRPMGRVDGIILEFEPGRQPRVVYIELGSITLADRLSGRLSSFISRMVKRKSSDCYRIPWNKLHIGLNEVTADVEAEKTPALEWELWLRKKIIGRIPGA
jgi:hypothetical protein